MRLAGRAFAGGRRGALGLLLLGLLVTLAAAAAPPASARAVAGALARLGTSEGTAVARLSGVRRRSEEPPVGISLAPSRTRPHLACPEAPCEAIVDPPAVRESGHWRLPAGGSLLEGGGEKGGLDPQDLQSAYDIPTSGASNQTIALVDADGYPAAESDLATYRERYGLPPCTTANGCFRKVNEQGEEANYPSASPEWDTESALDLDMASATCPSCHILLVEAGSSSIQALARSVNTAAGLGATEISNSYAIEEGACGQDHCEEYNSYYDHPGVLIAAGAGDWGYENQTTGGEAPNFPASSPYVVAVGGTSLQRASNARGWSEEVWAYPEGGGGILSGTGSGCSLSEPKPVWQTDPSCANRSDNDVAAVGACITPLSVYVTPEYKGWANVCGTSASTPIVAGIEAHASAYARSLPGADAFYADGGGLFDVTGGSNGECTPPAGDEYLCHAELGYDGPTGNGTPNGPLELESAPPMVATRPAGAVTATTATINGEVDAQGLETRYSFEYGTSTSYGASAPASGGAAGSGVSEHAVNTTLTGLQPDTTYHYRLLASNGAGASTGADATFRTALPSVTGIAPHGGPTDGGTSVTVSGANFVAVTAVRFGSSDAKSFVVESPDVIKAVAPKGSGTVDVTVTTPAGTSSASTADQFTDVLLDSARAWGQNGGSLGDGVLADSDTAVEVGALPEVTALSAGGVSLALLADGEVESWGSGENGGVGDGGIMASLTPSKVCAPGVGECTAGPYLKEVAAVSAGGTYSLALLKNGTVVAWGRNYWGELGSGYITGFKSRVPTPVCTVEEDPCKPQHYLKEVTAVAAGDEHGLALLENGTVVSWGENEHGALGDGGTANSYAPVPVCAAGERKVPCANRLGDVTAIAAGDEDSVALLGNGTVLAWGDNQLGELGDGVEAGSDVPVAVCAAGESAPCGGVLGEVQAIAAGGGYGLALLKDGAVKAWGYNYEGELGDGTFTSGGCDCSRVPVAVGDLSEVTAIAAGETADDSLALRKDGELLAWGGNFDGSLGDGDAAAAAGAPPGTEGAQDTPVPVCATDATGPCPDGPYLYGEGKVVAIATGHVHDLVSLALPSTPTVAGVQPGMGAASGGTRVNIVGTNLGGTTAVDFGAAPATEVQVDSATEVSAVAPPGSGTVDVTVQTPGATSAAVSSDRFTYEPPPAAVTGAASSVQAHSATVNGTVDPNGLPVSECYFEYSVSPFYDSSAPCTTLPGAGTSPVAVSASLADLVPAAIYDFRLVAANAYAASYGIEQSFMTPPASRPTITGVTPDGGLDAGGTTVTITGAELAEATAVKFGASEAQSFTVESSTSITAQAPAGTGTVNVSVTTPAGTTPSVEADEFTYVPPGPAPTVTKLSAKKGVAAGDTSLTITGTGFVDVTAVKLGATNASSVTVNSANSITAVTPAGSTGVADVTVTTPNGTSAVSAKARFTYEEPTVSEISPSRGSTAGRNVVTVTGSGFYPGASGASFLFGKTVGSDADCSSTSTCTVIVPAVPRPGTVDVRARVGKLSKKNPPGDQYTYE